MELVRVDPVGSVCGRCPRGRLGLITYHLMPRLISLACVAPPALASSGEPPTNADVPDQNNERAQ